MYPPSDQRGQIRGLGVDGRQQRVDRDAPPCRVELRPLRHAVDVDGRGLRRKRQKLLPRPRHRLVHLPADREAPLVERRVRGRPRREHREVPRHVLARGNARRISTGCLRPKKPREIGDIAFRVTAGEGTRQVFLRSAGRLLRPVWMACRPSIPRRPRCQAVAGLTTTDVNQRPNAGRRGFAVGLILRPHRHRSLLLLEHRPRRRRLPLHRRVELMSGSRRLRRRRRPDN